VRNEINIRTKEINILLNFKRMMNGTAERGWILWCEWGRRRR